jgi:hypothetical protein
VPKTWSTRDERKYQHIKSSEKKRGASAERAKEVAARTVNRDRREEGRTPNKTTQGTGHPGSELEDRTLKELRNRAAQLHVDGRSKMRKAELVDAIRRAQ